MQLSKLSQQQIFGWGDHFHLLLRRTACLAMIVGLCWKVGSNYILQHRHHGCYPYVGGSRPESLKFVSELPRLTLQVSIISMIPANYLQRSRNRSYSLVHIYFALIIQKVNLKCLTITAHTVYTIYTVVHNYIISLIHLYTLVS